MNWVNFLFMIGIFFIILEMFTVSFYSIIIGIGLVLGAITCYFIEHLFNLNISISLGLFLSSIYIVLTFFAFNTRGVFKAMEINKDNGLEGNNVDVGASVELINSTYIKDNKTIKCTFKGVRWSAIINNLDDDKSEKIVNNKIKNGVIVGSKGTNLLIDI